MISMMATSTFKDTHTTWCPVTNCEEWLFAGLVYRVISISAALAGLNTNTIISHNTNVLLSEPTDPIISWSLVPY